MFTCFLYIKPLPFSVEWGSHINSLYFSSVIFRCLFLKNEWGYISCVPCRGFCLIFLLVDWNIRLWPPVLDFLAHPAFSQVSFYGPFVHKLWQESKEKILFAECPAWCQSGYTLFVSTVTQTHWFVPALSLIALKHWRIHQIPFNFFIVKWVN